jgi:hypothetical protein
MSNFVISSEVFADRVAFTKEEVKEEIQGVYALTEDQIVNAKAMPETPEKEVSSINSVTTETVDSSTTSLETLQKLNTPIVEQQADSEAKSLATPLTLSQLSLEPVVRKSLQSVMIDDMLEKTYSSAEAVVASRLAYTKSIADLVLRHDTLTNAVLSLAESFSVVLPSDRINQTTREIMRVNIPVTKEGAFSAHELALITVYLRKLMDKFPQTAKELNSKIENLQNDLSFGAAQITGLRNKIKELESIKPNIVTAFIIKRQGRERFLYVENKKVRSSSTLLPQCIYTSYETAESQLVYAIKHRNSTKVRRVIAYQIIQMQYLNPMPASAKIQEVIRNASK